MTMPSLQLSGSFSSSCIFSKRQWRISVAISRSSFNTCADLFWAWCFPIFNNSLPDLLSGKYVSVDWKFLIQSSVYSLQICRPTEAVSCIPAHHVYLVIMLFSFRRKSVLPKLNKHKHACTCKHTCTHVHTHAHTHTHTHAHHSNTHMHTTVVHTCTPQ